ncbi:AraC family transcriptional regulator [Dickeya dianthicola]|uniref:AraC family ligand binding domain-containing protein n=1 Tax=Dickeya dianthicola TaxID=204039 RepID=UPI0013696C60|nr:AraC family transcriptional regulator [Dickeya dianthicola]MZI87997.1 AraC family transcriptional regulator [Dickeya dianthicola]
MIKVNKKEWKSTSSPLERVSLEQRLLFSTDTTDFSKKTESHSHNWIQFIYTRTGTVYVEVDGKFLHLPPLHGVWIPKNNEHSLWSSEKAGYICINVNGDFAENIPNIDCKIVEVSTLVDSYAEYFMKCSLEEVKNIELKEHVFFQFLTELNEVDFTLPYPISSELIALCREIQSDPGLPHSPEECEQKLNISLSTFVRRFKKETGLTYQEWRQRMRLLKSITRIKKRIVF